jgi:hypothetical protein
MVHALVCIFTEDGRNEKSPSIGGWLRRKILYKALKSCPMEMEASLGGREMPM